MDERSFRSLASSTSKSLISRIRANDGGAWERLVELYAPLVYYWCREARVAEADSADIAQEVFRAVALHVATFKKSDEVGSFRGWLRVITRNKVNDFLRKLERTPHVVGGSEAQARLAELPAAAVSSENVAAASSSDADSERALYRTLFQRALKLIRAEFEERTWQAFWRVVVDDQPATEVAKELDMRPGTVRVCKSRVLHRLRQELGDLWE